MRKMFITPSAAYFSRLYGACKPSHAQALAYIILAIFTANLEMIHYPVTKNQRKRKAASLGLAWAYKKHTSIFSCKNIFRLLYKIKMRQYENEERNF